MFGENIIDHARSLDTFRVGSQYHQAFLRVIYRHPKTAFDIIAFKIFEQFGGLDSIRFVGLIGDTKEGGKCFAQRRQADLKLVNQDVFYVNSLAPRSPRGQLKFGGGNDRVLHQKIIFGFGDHLLLALAQRHCQSLRQFLHALCDYCRERLIGLVVYKLNDTDQIIRTSVDNRCNQHLLGAVTGTLIDIL